MGLGEGGGILVFNLFLFMFYFFFYLIYSYYIVKLVVMAYLSKKKKLIVMTPVLYIFCFHLQVDLRDKPALEQIFASTK